MTTSYPAQIVFTEVDSVLGPRRWRGRLLRRSACVDASNFRASWRRVTWTPYFDITEDPDGGWCTVKMNGGPTGSSVRYARHPSVTEAQQAGIRWAGRRFRVFAEGTPS